MKLLVNVGIIATACALTSAAPVPAKEPGRAEPWGEARRQATEGAFGARGTVQLAQPSQGQARTDPKWVESMQQLLKDLADDNARLREENQGLRADAEALKRQLEVYEQERRQRKQNQGTFVLPPDALKSLQVPKDATDVPPGWRPFQFNGATYYIVPLKDGPNGQARPVPAAKGTIQLTPRGGGAGGAAGAGTGGIPVEPAPAAVPR